MLQPHLRLVFPHVQIQEGLKPNRNLRYQTRNFVFPHVQIQEGLKPMQIYIDYKNKKKVFPHVQIQEGLKLSF